jgi:hypothetical protein
VGERGIESERMRERGAGETPRWQSRITERGVTQRTSKLVCTVHLNDNPYALR